MNALHLPTRREALAFGATIATGAALAADTDAGRPGRPLRLGLQGWVSGDLTDVTPDVMKPVPEMGYTCLGAHITPAATEIDRDAARRAVAVVRDVGLDFLQLWGPYPCIIPPDESARRTGVKAAIALVRLAAAMGLPAAGIRPTSLNPQGPWRAHRDHFTDEVEDRFCRSLGEIVAAAREEGVSIVLEASAATVLSSPRRVKRIVERVDPRRISVNLDPVNFVADFRTATDPTPMVDELFDVLGPHAATVHIKDFALENRHVIHVAEVPPCTGLMDMDTVLRRTAALAPEVPAIVEHLPRKQVPESTAVLIARIRTLGIPLALSPAYRQSP